MTAAPTRGVAVARSEGSRSEGMTQPVIFLDIDGVLANVATRYRHGDPACVARLNRITDATGARIVVSSTWRFQPDIKDKMAAWGVTGEVIGITPDGSKRDANGLYVSVPRGHEIYDWMFANHYDGTRIAILDDDNDMELLVDFLVRTDTYLGLQDADVDKAIALLQVPT